MNGTPSFEGRRTASSTSDEDKGRTQHPPLKHMIMKKINFYYGLGDRASNYKAFSKYFNIIKIDWNKPEKVKSPRCDIAVGFSMGCLLALDYIEKHRVKKLILCSLPPCEKLGAVNANEIIFMAGSKEKFILKNIRSLAKKLSQKTKYRIIVVPRADHRIVREYKKRLLEITTNI